MHPPERPRLRDAIIRHLRDAGSDSISGVARALSETAEAPAHRLTVAGHLAAMTEEGTLKEVDRPPSKHYQVRDDHRHRTVHERVGAIVGSLDIPAPDRSAAAASLLGHLFGRLIFLAELKACGFASPGRYVEPVDASEDQRRAIRHLFREDGPHPMEIPRADPLLQVHAGAISSATLQDGMRRLILDATESIALCLPDEGPRGIQSRLELGGPHDD